MNKVIMHLWRRSKVRDQHSMNQAIPFCFWLEGMHERAHKHKARQGQRTRPDRPLAPRDCSRLCCAAMLYGKVEVTDGEKYKAVGGEETEEVDREGNKGAFMKTDADFGVDVNAKRASSLGRPKHRTGHDCAKGVMKQVGLSLRSQHYPSRLSPQEPCSASSVNPPPFNLVSLAINNIPHLRNGRSDSKCMHYFA